VANGTEKLVAQASLQLPHTHLDSNFTKVTVVRLENAADPGHGPSKIIVQWGSKEDGGSYAELHITPLHDEGSSIDDWMMVSCFYNPL